MAHLTFGSLFAGIGGFDLGFERAGFECRWQVEIDNYATKILEKHWPKVHRERDIRECNASNLGRVDCIIGGFPWKPGDEAVMAAQDYGAMLDQFALQARRQGERVLVRHRVSGAQEDEP